MMVRHFIPKSWISWAPQSTSRHLSKSEKNEEKNFKFGNVAKYLDICTTFMNIWRVQRTLPIPRRYTFLCATEIISGNLFCIRKGIAYQVISYRASLKSSKCCVTLFPKWQKKYNQNMTVPAGTMKCAVQMRWPAPTHFGNFDHFR